MPGLGLGQVTTNVAGGLASGLFAIGGDFGSDLAGTDVGTLSFEFTQPGPLATNLSATNGGAISLVLVSDTLIQGRDNGGLGDVVFTIEIVGLPGPAQIQLTQFEAVHHGDDVVDVFDEIATLLTGAGSVQLQYEVTRTDGDGDSITVADQIDLITTGTSFFTFDDDGPTLDG